MIAYRSMDARDRRFVVDGWAKGLRESDHGGLIQMRDWFPVMIPQLEQLVSLPAVSVLVAYDPADRDRVADIYGWLCFERQETPLVYYVFVKSAYRRRGIARSLFERAGIELDRPFRYACRTYIVDELEKDDRLKRMAPYATFDRLAGCH